ncbi:MAG: LTA synthase family protein [Clostridia bacterium]|nr:LTA synthase family protein [Clostridia bacterium]
MKKIKFSKRLLISALLLLGGNLLFFFTIWLLSKYDQIQLDQVIFQMKSPASGAHKNLLTSAFLRVGVFGFALTGLEIFLYLLLSGRLTELFKKSRKYLGYCTGKVCAFFKKTALPFSSVMLIFSLTLFSVKLDVFGYAKELFTESDFIKENYVDPSTAQLTFPKEKRNLIYIFLESMESTYADPNAGGLVTENFIPELSKLAEENVHFSNTEGLGGALSYTGTTWTAAAMVAQTSGIVVKVPLSADTYGGEDEFIPGIVSIGEVLEKEGYNQTLLLGSDAAFAGRDSYFTEHGNYNIVDIVSLKAEGRLPEDYLEFWGYEDQKLFQFAKEELTKLAAQDAPFNFTTLTVDTHFPAGYLCPQCGSEYEEQYANVLACSSKQVYEFVQWIQAQEWYKNTTIIISGDHLTMDPEFLADIDENYTRTIYNCIINAPIEPVQETNRQFGTFDMLPTTLATLGVEIEGDRLGLGTNLFSDQKTLTEEYGFEGLSEELNKKSVFYNNEFLGMQQKSHLPQTAE